MDGFHSLPVGQLEEGTPLNLDPYRNEYSPFSRVHEAAPERTGDDVLIDSYYGLPYDHWIRAGGAAYGLTKLLPPGPLDDLATGYLRIPFARVPSIDAPNREVLLRAIQVLREAYPEVKLLFRGQAQEYLLNRSPATLEALYGADVREPSLLPSAERRGVNVDAVGPAWCGLLRWILDAWASARADDAQFRQINKFGQHYLFHHFALAMAQHYGLASSGVDVTDSLDVALFFALHRFSRLESEPVWLNSARVDSGRPVLYVVGLETDEQYLRFEHSIVSNLPDSRPARQAAFFLHRGWGMARNRAARDLLAAFYLDPGGDYGQVPDTAELFPGPDEDLLGQALASFHRVGDSLPELNRLVQDFAWVR